MSGVESMTGAAAVRVSAANAPFEIWLKSVNHRFFEAQLRLPDALGSLEGELIARLRRVIRRGRVEGGIVAGDAGVFQRVRLNRSVVEQYQTIAARIAPGAPVSAADLLRLPGVVTVEQRLPEEFPAERIFAAFDRAAAALVKDRRREGRGLAAALGRMLDELSALLKGIAARRKALRAGLRKRAAQEEGAPEEFDRGEIREELDRFQLHLRAVRDLLRKGGDDAGKRIDFFTQEMLREANTIGSKARDFEIRRDVVEIKTQLENLREQARNLC